MIKLNSSSIGVAVHYGRYSERSEETHFICPIRKKGGAYSARIAPLLDDTYSFPTVYTPVSFGHGGGWTWCSGIVSRIVYIFFQYLNLMTHTMSAVFFWENINLLIAFAQVFESLNVFIFYVFSSQLFYCCLIGNIYKNFSILLRYSSTLFSYDFHLY